MSVGESRASATSRSLIARVRSNDAGAWDRLVALYAPLVFHHCKQARLSNEDAADVFQDVFQAAFTKIATFEKRAKGDTFRGWLRTITRNKVNDHFRRRRREPHGVGGSEVQRALAQVGELERDAVSTDQPAELSVLRAALDIVRPQVKERTWRAFLLTALEGRPPADVAQELGMEPGAVRVAKCRVLQRLRAELGDLI